MGNMVDYVKEVGKISFLKKPFGSVDSLILSELSYFKYDGIVPGIKESEVSTDSNKDGITIEEISHIRDVDNLFQGLIDLAENRALLLAAANSRRFGKMKLNYYVNEIKVEEETQFSAVTFFMDYDNTYIAFRGTDETIIGWKEDFNMGFLSPVPAQKAGLDYLKTVVRRFAGDFFVGGHSKGGNVAVYASMQADAAIQKRMRTIFSHDGPGFKDAIFEEEGYQNIKDKIQKIIPHSSTVGLLLQHQEEHTVVRSDKAGLLQHDPFSWVVEKEDFVYLNEVDRNAMLMNQTLNQWFGEMEDSARKELVDTIFGIISATELETTLELSEEWKKMVSAIIGARKELDEETRKFLKETFRQLVRMGAHNFRGLGEKKKKN